VTTAVAISVALGSEPNRQVADRSSRQDLFQMREVLDTIAPADPSSASIEVTCISNEVGASGCITPAEARSRDVVLLDRGGETRYRLGPAVITGADVGRATAGPAPAAMQGASGWTVVVSLTPEASGTLADVTTRLVGRQLAMVVDDVVVSAPTVATRITSGDVVISGGLSQEEAQSLAARLDADA
jgi:preprotein translocase subunit SecD